VAFQNTRPLDTHGSAKNSWIQGFEHLRSDFVWACIPCNLPSFKLGELRPSYSSFLTKCTSCVLMLWLWLGLKGFWNTLSICQCCPPHCYKQRKTPFWSLMNLAVWDILPRRRRIVCHNTLQISQYGDWNPCYVQNSTKIAFWTFYRGGSGL